MGDELLDVCDEENNLTGEKKMKSFCHRYGVWHRSSHIWVYNSKDEILLQERASEKILYPDMWDVSVAGHVPSGEEPIDAAIRELFEEIGLSAKKEDLEFLGIRKTTAIFEEFTNNEFYYVYMMRYDGDVSKLKLQKNELSDAKFFQISTIFEELNTVEDKYVPHDDYWSDMILEVIKRQKK